MKQSLTNSEKAIAICTLQASVNKLKCTLLENSVAIWELKEVNVDLTTELCKSDQASRVWMGTACLLTVMFAFIASVYMP